MNNNKTESVASAQQLRLRRTKWGFVSHALTMVVAAGLYGFGMLPADRVVHYLLLVVLMSATFVILIRTDLNLRFSDPSMTAAQIIAPLWPAIYLMFFVTDPQARTAFLLLATGALLYGMFTLTRRGMLLVGWVIVGAYLILLITLQYLAPARIDWRVESIVVFAYVSVLMLVAYLGSYIAGLRHRLKEQNLQLKELATRDSLTQLPNRRSVMERLEHERSRFERRSPNNTALCISMLDIDHFKSINDTWGHDTGDAVLCRIGRALQACMRKGDFIGRFGGEEFVIILPETTVDVAQTAALRIQQTIASLVFPELPEGKRVTVSQGLAIHRSGEGIVDTLKRADQALYEAKQAGRNQMVLSSSGSG